MLLLNQLLGLRRSWFVWSDALRHWSLVCVLIWSCWMPLFILVWTKMVVTVWTRKTKISSTHFSDSFFFGSLGATLVLKDCKFFKGLLNLEYWLHGLSLNEPLLLAWPCWEAMLALIIHFSGCCYLAFDKWSIMVYFLFFFTAKLPQWKHICLAYFCLGCFDLLVKVSLGNYFHMHS